MKAAVVTHLTRNNVPSRHMYAIAEGLRRHGVEVVALHDRAVDVDFCVVWGWRKARRIKDNGFSGPVLVAEHGYLGDRIHTWTSLGWDGLNGRARFPAPQDEGQRFWSNHAHLAKEWERFDGYWLIAGQVLGDQSLLGVDYLEWLKTTITGLMRMGVDVRFRPHPEAVRRGQDFPVPKSLFSSGTLERDLSEAACVVAYNSNATVDAVVAGIPAVTADEGAMAWDVTAHHYLDEIITPDRSEWFRRMAWTQWTMPEIASGEAWEVVKTAMQP